MMGRGEDEDTTAAGWSSGARTSLKAAGMWMEWGCRCAWWRRLLRWHRPHGTYFEADVSDLLNGTTITVEWDVGGFLDVGDEGSDDEAQHAQH